VLQRTTSTEAKADEVFDLMEKFAGYGFNKSHAAAYSLLAYHTGLAQGALHGRVLLRQHDGGDGRHRQAQGAVRGRRQTRPALSSRRMSTGAVHRFEPVSDKLIRYGLGAIKGTGQQAIEAIVRPHEGDGPFTSLFDFCVRVDRTRLNKRCLEALIKAGAFDNAAPQPRLAGGLDRPRLRFRQRHGRPMPTRPGCSTWAATTTTAPARRSPIWWTPRPGVSRSS
jgi:DNA polymerase-3 subunit alpha